MKPVHLIAITVALIACSNCLADEATWPQSVYDALWVPEDARTEKQLYQGGRYDILYAIKACYPAKEFIDDLVGRMTQKGWRRLQYDPRNPQSPLNHALPSGPSWSAIYKKANNAFGWEVDYLEWIEQWRDKDGNLVGYYLKYPRVPRTPRESRIATCRLSPLTNLTRPGKRNWPSLRRYAMNALATKHQENDALRQSSSLYQLHHSILTLSLLHDIFHLLMNLQDQFARVSQIGLVCDRRFLVVIVFRLGENL